MDANSKGQILYAGSVAQGSNNKRILIFDSDNKNADNSLKIIYDIPINITNSSNNFNFIHATSIDDVFYVLTYNLGISNDFSIREIKNGVIVSTS
jgi:hypothetical protein